MPELQKSNVLPVSGLGDIRDQSSVRQVGKTRVQPRVRTVLLLTCIAAFMGYLDVTIVNVSFPSIQSDFAGDATNSVIWVLDIYSVVLAGLLLVAGRLSDLVGHRRMFLVGVALFTGASAVCAVAPSLNVLIAARGVQAVGAAIFTPSSLALILRLHEREARVAAVATWTAAAALAAAVGPALGGALTGEGGTWRWIFIVNVPVGIGVVVAGRLLIPRLEPRGEAPDLSLSALLLAAAFLAALAITRGRIWGWGSATTVGAASASIVSLVLFTLQNRRSRHRILDGAFYNTLLVTSNTVTFLVSLAFFAYLLSGVLFLNHVWGYSVLESGMVMSAAPVCAIPTALLSAARDRVHARALVAMGVLLIGLFGVGAQAGLGGRPDLLLWLVLGAVLGMGVGSSLPLLSALAVEAVGEDRFATASALNSTVRQFAAVLAFAAVAAIVSVASVSAATFAPIWLGIALTGGLGLLVCASSPAGFERRDADMDPDPAMTDTSRSFAD